MAGSVTNRYKGKNDESSVHTGLYVFRQPRRVHFNANQPFLVAEEKRRTGIGLRGEHQVFTGLDSQLRQRRQSASRHGIIVAQNAIRAKRRITIRAERCPRLAFSPLEVRKRGIACFQQRRGIGQPALLQRAPKHTDIFTFDTGSGPETDTATPTRRQRLHAALYSQGHIKL